MERGATAYVPKDRLARLGPSVERALEEWRQRRAKQQGRPAVLDPDSILIVDDQPVNLRLLCDLLEEVLARVKHHLALRRLQQKLRRLNASLEQKVEERTRALSQANARLCESEEKLRSISDNSPDFMLLVSIEGDIQFINRTLTGQTVECETVGGSHGSHDHRREPKGPGQHLVTALSTPKNLHHTPIYIDLCIYLPAFLPM